jgi:hypothetical protein
MFCYKCGEEYDNNTYSDDGYSVVSKCPFCHAYNHNP